jgi:hypothetical protein
VPAIEGQLRPRQASPGRGFPSTAEALRQHLRIAAVPRRGVIPLLGVGGVSLFRQGDEQFLVAGRHNLWSRGQTTRVADHKQTTDHRKTAANTDHQQQPKTWRALQKRRYRGVCESGLVSLVKRRSRVRISLPAPRSRRSGRSRRASAPRSPGRQITNRPHQPTSGPRNRSPPSDGHCSSSSSLSWSAER